MDLWTVLRERLRGHDAYGHRGTLRWLEGVVDASGGHAGTVRNIVYKDLGSTEQKSLLFEVLSDWHVRVGLPPPEPPGALVRAAAKERLGANARGIFTTFLRDLSGGRLPQQVVVGPARSGTMVLLAELRSVLRPHVFLGFTGDAAPMLRTMLASDSVADARLALGPCLDARQPYAVQEAAQGELRVALRQALQRLGVPLLVATDGSCHLGGCALRGPDGAATNPSWWVEELLQGISSPYLAVLRRPPRRLAFRRLHPPDRVEALRFLQRRLQNASTERIQELVDLAGHDYAELAIAAVLESCRLDGGPSAALLADPTLGPLLRALAALCPSDDPWIPCELLEAVVGISCDAMSGLQRSLVEGGRDGKVRPAEPALLPDEPHEPELDAIALAYYERHPHPARQLRHAQRSGDHASMLSWLRLDPALLALAPNLWESSRTWPRGERERLATVVLRRHAVLRHHDHPEVRAAMEVLRSSPSGRGSIWADLELAEACLDSGRFERAGDVLDQLGELTGEERARALLVRAALARWGGSYERAEDIVNQVMALDLPEWMVDRAQLWRGLIAKDRGDLDEALDHLARVTRNSLLMARARYHVGDALLHLGQPVAAAQRLDEALRTLAVEGSAEELTRVRTRRAAAMRRVGRYLDAARDLELAMQLAPDEFSRQRVALETAALEATRGHGWEALCRAAGAVRFFEQAKERPDDARFRRSYGFFRLAAAQRTLESGDPYRPPFRQVLAPRAASTLRELSDDLGSAGRHGFRDASLRFESRVLWATCVEPGAAPGILARLGNAPSPVHACTAVIATAQALTAAGRAAEALTEFARLPPLPPDPGLNAWAHAVCAETLLRLGRIDEGAAAIQEIADLPGPFREQVGRAWGAALMALDPDHRCAHWGLEGAHLPLSDALAWALGAGPEPPRQPACATKAVGGGGPATAADTPDPRETG
jgi:tetratricopeptide (TPR) repeat protein